ncbi:MAG: hypothetical protein FJ267_13545 [Planctomycetes bacterium]|nr:hypothetical protein [Planctomycetota bacterium]
MKLVLFWCSPFSFDVRPMTNVKQTLHRVYRGTVSEAAHRELKMGFSDRVGNVTYSQQESLPPTVAERYY